MILSSLESYLVTDDTRYKRGIEGGLHKTERIPEDWVIYSKVQEATHGKLLFGGTTLTAFQWAGYPEVLLQKPTH